MIPVRITETITDIYGMTLKAGDIAWIRREYPVNGGREIRLALEDTEGALLMSCVPPEYVERLPGTMPLSEALKEVRG